MLKMHVKLFSDAIHILVLPNIWALFTLSLFDTECHNIRLCVLLRLGSSPGRRNMFLKFLKRLSFGRKEYTKALKV